MTEELERGWAECVTKIALVNDELGAWAAMRAARMLALDLRSGFERREKLSINWLKSWFAPGGDDGDERPAVADAPSLRGKRKR